MSLRQSNSKFQFILYAPSINSGGGLSLLKSLLANSPVDYVAIAYLDIRIRRTTCTKNWKVNWVNPTLLSRIFAEFKIYLASNYGDKVLCFHGLPPIFRLNGYVSVYKQNRNHMKSFPLKFMNGWIFWRTFFERQICNIFSKNVDHYIFQTKSMEKDFQNTATNYYFYSNKNIPRSIYPFYDFSAFNDRPNNRAKKWDFLYVASGEPHKNHLKLLEAWLILAKRGVEVSLALTVSSDYKSLIAAINKLRDEYNLRIDNLGWVGDNEVRMLYSQSTALIYPSISESFGLPLLEASFQKIPIIAAELDYVRDICCPSQTFNPYSAESIARAVERYLQKENAVSLTKIHHPSDAIQFFTTI